MSSEPEDRRLYGMDYPLKGVFSTTEFVRVGSGTRAASVSRKTYWYVESRGKGHFEARRLNDRNVPGEPVRHLRTDQFLADYAPEIDHYHDQVLPAMRDLEQALARGDRHRERGRLYSAEMEFSHVLDVDEENVRATFGLGLTYLARPDLPKAQTVFDRLVELKAAFDPRHKHMFNEFGIALRRSGLLDEALLYYFRAVELDSEDENLLFNIARVYYEKNDYANCLQHLALCLDTGQGVEEARLFCRYLNEKIREPEGLLLLGASASRLNADVTRLLERMEAAAGEMDAQDANAMRQRVRERAAETARRQREAVDKARAEMARQAREAEREREEKARQARAGAAAPGFRPGAPDRLPEVPELENGQDRETGTGGGDLFEAQGPVPEAGAGPGARAARERQAPAARAGYNRMGKIGQPPPPAQTWGRRKPAEPAPQEPVPEARDPALAEEVQEGPITRGAERTRESSRGRRRT